MVVWATVDPVVDRATRKWVREQLHEPLEGVVTGIRFKKEGALVDYYEDSTFRTYKVTEFRETRTLPVLLVTIDIYQNPLVALPRDVELVGQEP